MQMRLAAALLLVLALAAAAEEPTPKAESKPSKVVHLNPDNFDSFVDNLKVRQQVPLNSYLEAPRIAIVQINDLLLVKFFAPWW